MVIHTYASSISYRLAHSVNQDFCDNAHCIGLGDIYAILWSLGNGNTLAPSIAQFTFRLLYIVARCMPLHHLSFQANSFILKHLEPCFCLLQCLLALAWGSFPGFLLWNFSSCQGNDKSYSPKILGIFSIPPCRNALLASRLWNLWPSLRFQ